MNKIKYRLGTWPNGSQRLTKKELGVGKTLAHKLRGVWKFRGEEEPSGRFDGKFLDITEEEASMILFQCKGEV